MTVLLAICMIGNAVFAKLPADNQPTLRQAIVAAGETPGSHLSNLDKKITGWSYECDGDNYAAAYFVANTEPAEFGKLWIARYDDGKKAWTQASSIPPGSDSTQTSAQEVITLFYDGYYLYVQLQNATGTPATLQFRTDLTYKREFFGQTKVGITDGALLYIPNTDAVTGDPAAAIFDPDTGLSRGIFPPEHPTATMQRGAQSAAGQVQACGQQWFDEHGIGYDKKNPFRAVAGAHSNLATDSLVFAVIYGQDPAHICPQGIRDPIGALYVYIHPDDPKRMKFVEQPITDWKHFDGSTLGTFLTKESLAKLFGAS
jgi:hypothetical protein